MERVADADQRVVRDVGPNEVGEEREPEEDELRTIPERELSPRRTFVVSWALLLDRRSPGRAPRSVAISP